MSTTLFTPLARPAWDSTRKRLLRGWALGLALYAVAMVWLMGMEGDFRIADALFSVEGGRWALRGHWVTTTLIHETGKRLSLLLWLGLAVAAALLWKGPQWRRWRGPLLRLLASVAGSALLVATLKHGLPHECPWHLLRYGGELPYVPLWQARPAGMPVNACFPAAHASTGFAWIALYFFFLCTRPRWRLAGLAFGLVLGGIFALSQELRGAHFLSHDLTTLMLCWTVALLVFLPGLREGRA